MRVDQAAQNSLLWPQFCTFCIPGTGPDQLISGSSLGQDPCLEYQGEQPASKVSVFHFYIDIIYNICFINNKICSWLKPIRKQRINMHLKKYFPFPVKLTLAKMPPLTFKSKAVSIFFSQNIFRPFIWTSCKIEAIGTNFLSVQDSIT